MSKDLNDLNISIAAYERVLEFYQNLLDREGGEDAYIEERMHLLNCVYADFLLKRLDLRENVRVTECTPSSESTKTDLNS
jgi:hypothetical protein